MDSTLSTVFNLNNFSFDDIPSSFKLIVSKISGLNIPDDFVGLWRGSTITPGQLGENLKEKNVQSINAEILWKNLKGKWNIINPNSTIDFTDKDLGDLLLTDSYIDGYTDTTWLEEHSGKYRAKNELYTEYGLTSPFKDPTKQEIIKRRVQDPDDHNLIKDFLESLSNQIKNLKIVENEFLEVIANKTGYLEFDLLKYPSMSISNIENEIISNVFPKKLLIVVILSEQV